MRLTKKVMAVLVALMLGASMLTLAASPSDEITVLIDGVQVEFEGQGPILMEGRTLVPVRGVFEMLGFYPTWSGSTRTATLTREDYVVVLTIGSYTFTTNGVEHTLDVPAQLIGGRTLLPLRAVLESVGYDDMAWIPATRTVVIRTGADNDEPVATPTPAPTTPTPAPATPTPAPTTPTPAPAQSPAPAGQSLVGTWALYEFADLGMPFFIFRADGTATMYDTELGWTAINGILGLCSTPELCRGNCSAPGEWYYTLEGNVLTLEGRTISDLEPLVFYRISTNAPLPGPTPAPTPRPTPSPAQRTAMQPLLGVWTFLNMPFFEFRADGTGIMIEEDEFDWVIDNGVLQICFTPHFCRGNCIAPEEWYFTVDGNQLILDGRTTPDMQLTLRRE